jgi:hypothetical protein
MGLFRISFIGAIIFTVFYIIDSYKKLIKKNYIVKKFKLYEKINYYKLHIIIAIIIIFELLF